MSNFNYTGLFKGHCSVINFNWLFFFSALVEKNRPSVLLKWFVHIVGIPNWEMEKVCGKGYATNNDKKKKVKMLVYAITISLCTVL